MRRRRRCTATAARWPAASRLSPPSCGTSTTATPSRIWSGAATGAELFARIKELPGFGEQKAKIFVALLAKQLGVRPDGWGAAAGAYSEEGSFRSVADVVDAESLQKVRDFKKASKAAAKAAQD